MATVYDLSDRELHKELNKQRKRFDALEKLDTATVVSSGRADATLAEMKDAGETIERLAAERNRRKQAKQGDRLLQSIRASRAMHKQAEKAAAEQAALTAARQDALQALHDGPTLPVLPSPAQKYVAARLSAAEGKELLSLVRRWEADKRTWNKPKDLDRWETLVEQAAESPGMFERLRQETTLRETEERLREEERRAKVVQRPAPPPGTALLPAFLATWATNKSEGGLDFERLGILTAVLLGLENRAPTIVGGRFEDGPDGEPVMVVASDPRSVSRLGPGEAFAFLLKNKLLARERVDGELRITVGERIRNLYGTTEGGNTDGA